MTTIDRQSAFSGTREVAERLRFDVARLEDYLSAHVAGFAGPIVVSQFKGGQSNPTYLVETPLRRYVLRRKPPGKLLPSAHAVDREHRIISALSAPTLPGRRAGALLRRRQHRRHAVLRHGPCRGPRVLGAADAGVQSGRARGRLRRHERDHRAAAHVRSGRDRPVRLRPRRKLCGAPGRALVEAISRLGDPIDRGHGAPDRLAAGSICRRASRRGWCTATTGSTTSSLRPTRRRSQPCSIGSSRRSAIRWRISLII